MSENHYASPVDKLLTLGECKVGDKWPDYPAMGLKPEHVPELIRMATDLNLHRAEGDRPEVWAPLHAWRALGQLEAEAAAEPLTRMLVLIDEDADDWAEDELPEVFDLIGPAALDPLAAYLADGSHGSDSRQVAAEGLSRIGFDYPETLDGVISCFKIQLEKFAENPRDLNSWLVNELVEFGAQESAPLIRRAFEARRVDPTLTLNLESILDELDAGPDDSEEGDEEEWDAEEAEESDEPEPAPEPQYAPPVDNLLNYGECEFGKTWPDYVALGLTAEHVPELVRMAGDRSLHRAGPGGVLVYAPVHAWRALGQLKSEAAAGPLVELFDLVDDLDDDWAGEELPEVLTMIGPAAVPALCAYVEDDSRGTYGRSQAARALAKMAQANPETRDRAVAALTRVIERFADNDRALNGLVILHLAEMKAVESAPQMQAAFEADAVNLSIQGDWEDVQVAMGLLKERLTPRPLIDMFTGRRIDPEEMARRAARLEQLRGLPIVELVEPRTGPDRQAREKARKKRKEAAKARKRNRKRKR